MPRRSSKAENHSFQLGKTYLIRTVTLYYTGRLIRITETDLVLNDAAWIKDTGPFSEAIKTGAMERIEPFVDPVIVQRGGIIDATVWNHPLPRECKA